MPVPSSSSPSNKGQAGIQIPFYPAFPSTSPLRTGLGLQPRMWAPNPWQPQRTTHLAAGQSHRHRAFMVPHIWTPCGAGTSVLQESRISPASFWANPSASQLGLVPPPKPTPRSSQGIPGGGNGKVGVVGRTYLGQSPPK